MKKSEIIPSILTSGRADFLRRYRVASKCVKIVQLDVLNNSLVATEDFHDAGYINRLRPKIKFEVHLMVKGVLRELRKWRHPWVKKIIFHVEAKEDNGRIISAIKAMKKQVGIALNPSTSVSQILEWLPAVDTVLVMTVKPGRNGAPFIPGSLEKIRALRSQNKKVNIEVDGGIDPKTAKKCRSAGVNLFVVGSYLRNQDFEERYLELKKVVR